MEPLQAQCSFDIAQVQFDMPARNVEFAQRLLGRQGGAQQSRYQHFVAHLEFANLKRARKGIELLPG